MILFKYLKSTCMKTFFTNKLTQFSSICLFFLLLSFTFQGQNTIYQLHPVVGDTIESHELSRFVLFTDFLENEVDYCLLFVEDHQFELLGFKDNELQFSSVVSETEVLENAQNVDKLNAYYLIKEEKDSLPLTPLELQDIPVVEIKVDKEKLNKEMKQMKKQKDRREWDNDRHERVSKGRHMF